MLSDNFDEKSQARFDETFKAEPLVVSEKIVSLTQEAPNSQTGEKIIVISDMKQGRAKVSCKVDNSLEKKTMEELRRLAKQHNLKNTRGLNKEKLIEYLAQFSISNQDALSDGSIEGLDE